MTAVNSWFTGIFIETDWVQASKDVQKRHRFFNNMQRDLMKISTYPLGAELLDLIAKRHKGIGTSPKKDDPADVRTVTIRMAKDSAEGADTQAWVINNKFNVDKNFGGRSIKFAGKGSRTILYFHNDVGSEQIYTRLAGVASPTWITLAHELIHALHHLGGNTYSETVVVGKGAAKREEMFTTGLGPYANTRLSENALRDQANLPRRTFYSFPDDHSFIGSLAPVIQGNAARPGYWYCACVREYFG